MLFGWAVAASGCGHASHDAGAAETAGDEAAEPHPSAGHGDSYQRNGYGYPRSRSRERRRRGSGGGVGVDPDLPDAGLPEDAL